MIWPFKRNRFSIEPDDAWFVQLDGEAVAIIDDPQAGEMFWFWWRQKPVHGEPIPSGLWDYANDSRRSFRHCETGEITTIVVPAGSEAALTDGRALLRGPHKTGPGRVHRVV